MSDNVFTGLIYYGLLYLWRPSNIKSEEEVTQELTKPDEVNYEFETYKDLTDLTRGFYTTKVHVKVRFRDFAVDIVNIHDPELITDAMREYEKEYDEEVIKLSTAGCEDYLKLVLLEKCFKKCGYFLVEDRNDKGDPQDNWIKTDIRSETIPLYKHVKCVEKNIRRRILIQYYDNLNAVKIVAVNY